MTVNELFNVWIHKNNPYATVKVWDRHSGDYIFMNNSPLPGQDAEEIGKMEVKCFYCTFKETDKTPILTINVGEYN